MVLAADSISREKREGTLDLLLLTDLRALDVVVGKLTAKLVLCFYALLAIVPTLGVSTLIGGTSAGQCARLFLVWMNALFFSRQSASSYRRSPETSEVREPERRHWF